MRPQHLQIMTVIADLEETNPGKEIDEFSVAQRCGIVPAKLPRHNYVNSPARGQLLRTLLSLEQGKLIYVTKCGYWGMHLTNAGRERLASATRQDDEIKQPVAEVVVEQQPAQAAAGTPSADREPVVWEGPRPEAGALNPSWRGEYFYSSLALTLVTIGTVILFTLNHLPQSPLTRQRTASPVAQASPALPFENVPVAQIVTTPTPQPVPLATATPQRVFVVANTGGDGVYLRQSPLVGDRLSAFAEGTRLEEVGPEQEVDGAKWLHVRTPSGTEGYLPAHYTAPAQ